MMTHNLPAVIIPTPRVVIESFWFDSICGQYTLHSRNEYGTLRTARAKATHIARWYVNNRDTTSKYPDREWNYSRHKTRCDDFRLKPHVQKYGTGLIMRTSQYDEATQQYVTVDQFEFGP